MTIYKKPTTLKEIIYSIINDRDRLDILDHVIKELTAVAGTDPTYDTILAILISIREDLHAATVRSRSHPSTETIKALNQSRQKIIKQMFSGITFFLSSSTPAISGAANTINRSLIKHFAKLPDQKKRTLTAAIKGFLEDMERPGMSENIETITFSEIVSELKSKQVDIDQLIENRAKDEEKQNSPTLVPAREQMSRFISILEAHLYLNAYGEVAGTEELIHNLNGRIGEIMTTAKAIHTMEENSHQTESESSHRADSENEDLIEEKNPGVEIPDGQAE